MTFSSRTDAERRVESSLNDFDLNFRPDNYLENYYQDVDLDFIRAWIDTGCRKEKIITKNVSQENANLLIFYAKTISPLLKNAKCDKLLEVGGGATIYQLISIAPFVSTICFTDYLFSNIFSVQKWKNKNSSEWRKFILGSLLLENGSQPINQLAILQREKIIKNKLNKWGCYDVISNKMTPAKLEKEKFDIVSSNFCIESITEEKEVWAKSFRNLIGKLKSGGRLIITAIKGAKKYRVVDKNFPAVEIYEDDMLNIMESFNVRDIVLQSFENADSADHYQGMIMATGILS